MGYFDVNLWYIFIKLKIVRRWGSVNQIDFLLCGNVSVNAQGKYYIDVQTNNCSYKISRKRIVSNIFLFCRKVFLFAIFYTKLSNIFFRFCKGWIEILKICERVIMAETAKKNNCHAPINKNKYNMHIRIPGKTNIRNGQSDICSPRKNKSFRY